MSTKSKMKLEEVIKNNRIEWEPWIESAKDYKQLRIRLHQRGFKNTPMVDKSIVGQFKGKRSIYVDRLPNQKIMMKRAKKRSQ